MAVRRKRKTTSRTTARRSYRRSKRTSLKIKVNPSIAREIWAVVYFAIGVLTILSIQGGLGIIGDSWIRFLNPIFGWGIYLIPALFLLVSTMLFFSKKLNLAGSRVLGLFLFVTSVLSVLHLSVPIEKIHDFAVLGKYGGYIGFVTNFILLEVLGIGRIGATIIFVSTFIVSLLLVFEVSLRDLWRLLIPEIRIEKVAGKKDRDHKKLEDEDAEQPIMIRKSLINKDKDVIYEDEEEEKASVKPVVIDDKVAKDVEKFLTENEKKTEEAEYEWEFPSLDLLKVGEAAVSVKDEVLKSNADKIKQKLMQFGIDVKMHEINVGPTVIQYTLKPHEGVKLSKITGLKNDMALALAAERVRIEAPIPGKSLVGIEVPNSFRATVHLREILESEEFLASKSKLTLPLGRNVSGIPIVSTLDSMPHLLIAGATGSGKSVAVNAFLTSLLYQNSPKDLKFILIDPKRVELRAYNSIPHLLSPVIQDPEKAAISLRWVVSEMIRRYSQLSDNKVRNIQEFNDLKNINNLPRIIVVIDELADLMMAAGKEVEASICRIAQMARAVGIHLIVATQRPSVDVITGLIKANIPARISFAVSSQIDSRTIIDGVGAEDLLGRGDMLYLPTGQNKPVRIQGIFVSTEEVERVTNRVKLTIEPEYDDDITSLATAKQSLNGLPDSKAGMDEDSMYEAAFLLVKETRKASASLLQRRLKVGYARAARLIDILEENGVVGPADGAKPRKIIVD
ncbi:MAG: DNA translocase FtsK 4TM domain-containing protein [bacterium]|nr:DNA translocase FtsK 4TM domain-containing protein [bacterium]